MNGMRMWGGAVIIALSAISVPLTGLHAQSAVSASSTEQRASDLTARAEQLEMSYELEKAASVYREAAELQSDRPESVTARIHAGRLAFYVGHDRQALADYTEAGETALAWGDVVTAARAFLDAAWIAHESGRESTTAELLQRAQRLTESPHIGPAERSDLARRIVAQSKP